MTSVPPSHDAFRCPTCGSDNTTRSQLAYQRGVTHVSGVVEGPLAVGMVALRAESDAAHLHAPPPPLVPDDMYVRDPEGLLGMMGMVLSFIVIMAGVDLGAWISGVGAGGLAISATVYAIGWHASRRTWRAQTERDAAAQLEQMLWRQRMTCLRCGANWQP